jgi:CheY-like chemotaxis protein
MVTFSGIIASFNTAMNSPIHKVMALDDDPDCLAFVHAALGKEYQLTTLSDARDAVPTAVKISPDVIILDVMMPEGKDGFSVFCDLRQNERTRKIPVIMLTQVNELTELQFGTESMQEYLGEAPSAFLEKPIDIDHLQEEVKKAINA